MGVKMSVRTFYGNDYIMGGSNSTAYNVTQDGLWRSVFIGIGWSHTNFSLLNWRWKLANPGPNPVDPGPNLVSPVPEPETYAMLLAGLGLLGFTAKRRKKSA